MSEGGRADQRNGLREIGADQARPAEPRIEQHQHDDDERARTYRRHADDETADDADRDGRERLDCNRYLARARRPFAMTAQDRLRELRHRRDEQRAAKHRPQCRIHAVRRAQMIDESGAGEGARHRAEEQILHHRPVHGAAPEVDERSERLHEQRRDQIARDGRSRRDAEDQNQDRRHQRAAPHSRQADDQPNEEPSCGDGRFDVRHRQNLTKSIGNMWNPEAAVNAPRKPSNFSLL